MLNKVNLNANRILKLYTVFNRPHNNIKMFMTYLKINLYFPLICENCNNLSI